MDSSNRDSTVGQWNSRDHKWTDEGQSLLLSSVTVRETNSNDSSNPTTRDASEHGWHDGHGSPSSVACQLRKFEGYKWNELDMVPADHALEGSMQESVLSSDVIGQHRKAGSSILATLTRDSSKHERVCTDVSTSSVASLWKKPKLDTILADDVFSQHAVTRRDVTEQHRVDGTLSQLEMWARDELDMPLAHCDRSARETCQEIGPVCTRDVVIEAGLTSSYEDKFKGEDFFQACSDGNNNDFVQDLNYIAPRESNQAVCIPPLVTTSELVKDQCDILGCQQVNCLDSSSFEIPEEVFSYEHHSKARQALDMVSGCDNNAEDLIAGVPDIPGDKSGQHHSDALTVENVAIDRNGFESELIYAKIDEMKIMDEGNLVGTKVIRAESPEVSASREESVFRPNTGVMSDEVTDDIRTSPVPRELQDRRVHLTDVSLHNVDDDYDDSARTSTSASKIEHLKCGIHGAQDDLVIKTEPDEEQFLDGTRADGEGHHFGSGTLVSSTCGTAKSTGLSVEDSVAIKTEQDHPNDQLLPDGTEAGPTAENQYLDSEVETADPTSVSEEPKSGDHLLGSGVHLTSVLPSRDDTTSGAKLGQSDVNGKGGGSCVSIKMEQRTENHDVSDEQMIPVSPANDSTANSLNLKQPGADLYGGFSVKKETVGSSRGVETQNDEDDVPLAYLKSWVKTKGTLMDINFNSLATSVFPDITIKLEENHWTEVLAVNQEAEKECTAEVPPRRMRTRSMNRRQVNAEKSNKTQAQASTASGTVTGAVDQSVDTSDDEQTRPHHYPTRSRRTRSQLKTAQTAQKAVKIEREVKLVHEKNFKCKHCHKKFVTSKKLCDHMYIHTSRYQCDVCGRKCVSPSALNHHLLIHSGKLPHKCKYCGKAFNHPSNKYRHERVHQGLKPHKCSYCERAFGSSSELTAHERAMHTGHKPYRCEECGQSFICSSRLKSHSRVHTGEKPYRCTVCDASFANRQMLGIHERTHTGSPIQCKYCSKSFWYMSSLRRHEKLHGSTMPHECEICGKGFVEKPLLRMHKMMHSGKRSYKCQHCKKAFFNPTALKNHEKIHNPVRQVKCIHCGKTYANTRSLLDHQKIHTGKDLHHCQVCGKPFVTADKLERHMASHSRRRPYKCPTCHKSFKLKSYVTVHQKRHSGDKPHKCKVCNKAFTFVSDVKAHAIIHTDAKPFKCSFCGRSFNKKNNMLTHERRMHC